MPYDWLSLEVMRQLTQRLDQMVIKQRQSRAIEEETFIKAQLSEAAISLENTENRLASFLEGNRGSVGSATLQLERDRLEREVALSSRLFSDLASAAQQAGIDRVRSTPTLTVLEPPALPLEPDRRFLLRKTLLSSVAFFAFATIGVLLQHFRQPSRDIS
jgi:uncharacterized protein involved in exopolysaccharide biosynthesis